MWLQQLIASKGCWRGDSPAPLLVVATHPSFPPNSVSFLDGTACRLQSLSKVQVPTKSQGLIPGPCLKSKSQGPTTPGQLWLPYAMFSAIQQPLKSDVYDLCIGVFSVLSLYCLLGQILISGALRGLLKGIEFLISALQAILLSLYFAVLS